MIIFRLTPGQSFVALDREMDRAAFGPVWLRDTTVAKMVADAILYGEAGRQFCQLRAWVIMPNHVHVLRILGRTGEASWQDESFDHWVRNDLESDRIVRYLEHNPVNAGLANTPGDWAWSCAPLAGESACPT